MNVWLALPSKRPAAEVNALLSLWGQRGYRIAVFRDLGDEPVQADLLLTGQYRGYYATANLLAREILAKDADAEWLVFAGDDTEPDPNHNAARIALECSRKFGELNYQPSYGVTDMIRHSTFGVMQPTGDGHGIDTICGSPWVGREFAARMYGGRGPFCEEYPHCFGDNEMQDVTNCMGVLWQRPDLIHKHNHWSWTTREMPAFLAAANSPEHWDKYKALYYARRAAGFPGHEPIEIEVAA